MKKLKSSILIMFAVFSLFSCNAQTSENQNSENVISEEKLNYYLAKYNWQITNTTLNNENDLSKLYTWYTCIKK